MAKYRIAITNVEYGCIDVEADSLDEAMEKVESFDGDYFVHNNEITDTELIEILDKQYTSMHLHTFYGTIIVKIKVCLQEKNLLKSE